MAGRGGAIHPAPAVHAALGYPLGLGRPLAVLAAKSQVTVADLEGALVRLGLPRKQPGERKGDLVARLGVALADPVLVNGVVAAAPAAARELAYRLAGGRPTLPAQRAYGRSAGSPYEWLSQRLLVAPFDWYQAEMPREVGLALRGGEAGLADVAATRPEVVSSQRDPAVVSAAALAGAAEAVRITEAILEAWSAAPPAALKAGGIGVRDLKRAALASGSAEGDVGVYVEVAATAGLVRQAGDRFLPTSDYDAWRRGEPAQRWLRLATGWLAAGRLPSLAGERDDDDKPIAALNPKFAIRGVVGVRAAVLGALAGDPASAPEPKSLAAALLWDGPARWNSFPLNPPAAVDMILREAALLGVVGDGALSPWGLELAAGRYAAALAAAGALGRNETAVTLQADLTAVAAGPVSADLGAELGLLADVESRGAATVWRFSNRSISRAFDAGRTVDDILRFLAAHAGKGVPQTLEYLVGDVARRHGTIRAGSVASYVRADDPALVAELCGAKKLRRCGLRTVAPTVAVATVDAATLVPALRDAGYLAVEEDVGGTTVVRAPARRRAASTERPPAPLRPGPGGRRAGAAPDSAATPSPDDVGFWVVTGPPRPPADPAVDVPAVVDALRAAGKGPTGPVRRDPRTGRVIGAGTPGSRSPGSGVRGRVFPAEVSPFDGPDDDLDPFADLVEFDDGFDDDDDDDDDDDLGFDPDCQCPECVAAATRAVLGDDPVLLAQLSAMLEASSDDADERIALLDGACRDGRPVLIAYEHPRSGPATDVFRILTVTGTSAHLRDSSGRERLVDVEWIEAIVETGGGPSGRRGRGRSRK